MSAARRYGLANLAFAALYVWLAHAVVVPRSAALAHGLDVVSVVFGLSGLALLTGAPGARWLARLGCLLVLLVGLAGLAVLVGAQAFLTAIYGPLGQGGWVVALLAAALVVQFFVIVPLFELNFLLSKR